MRNQILIIACVFGVTSAAAQTTSSPTGSAGCVPTRSTADNNGVATAGRSNEPLSDKLAKADGVMCPPAGVDPEIRAPTPQGGSTPVIPPPGSPGGDPSVRPK